MFSYVLEKTSPNDVSQITPIHIQINELVSRNSKFVRAARVKRFSDVVRRAFRIAVIPVKWHIVPRKVHTALYRPEKQILILAKLQGFVESKFAERITRIQFVAYKTANTGVDKRMDKDILQRSFFPVGFANWIIHTDIRQQFFAIGKRAHANRSDTASRRLNY